MKSKSSIWKVVAGIEAIIIISFIIIYFINGNPKSKKDTVFLPPTNCKELTNITSEEAAKYFFEGCTNQDWEKVKNVCPFINQEGIKDYLGGLQIISIGKAYKSKVYPWYHGEYIPYEIKLKTGDIKKWNLAIRNDNEYKVWQIDGGI